MKATRGLDRGRTDHAAVDAAFRGDLERWIKVQREAGLDYFSDGLLHWQDLFRPLAEALGQQPHTLVRWFDTNTFYRAPELTRIPSINLQAPSPASGVGRGGGLGLMDASLPKPRVTTLPSPYLFSRAANTELDRNVLMRELATSVLRPAIDAAVGNGSELIHLQEPWIGYHGIAPSDWAPLREALDILHRDLGATLVFHVYFGDAAPHIEQLRRLPVDVIGVDLIETDVTALGSDWDQGLLAGAVDGRNSIVEPAETLVEVARHLAETVRPRDLYLSSNCELSYLPTPVAESKAQRLGEAARRLKELVSV